MIRRPSSAVSSVMIVSKSLQPLPFQSCSPWGTVVLATAALAAMPLMTSCGVGLAGGASAASSGGDSAPEGARLDVNASLPILSLTQFQEPTRAGEVVAGAIPAEPSKKLMLEFSGAIESGFSASAISVEIKRPGGAYIPVDVVEARVVTSRSVEVSLAGDTLHNSLYRVRINGLMSAGGAAQVPATTAYFVVRDGEWQAPEFITTSGGGYSGGVTIAGDLEHYSTLETYDSITDGRSWGTWTLSAAFGEPWLVPDLVYSRLAQGDEERGLQPQTSSLSAFDEVGIIRVHESNPSGPQSVNKSSYLRAAVGLYLDDSYPEDDRGFQFGPTVTVTSRNDVTGLVDRPGAAFGPTTDHFSFNGVYGADGRSVGAAFWALTELDGANQYTHAKVYANTALAAPFSGSVDAIDWAGWDPAIELSSAAEDYNSWPLFRQLPGGSGVAMWWSAASLQDVLEGNIEKYWLATWSAAGGWTGAVDVSQPPSSFPVMGMITDLRSTPGPNGPELVVFTRSSTGPAVAHLDLTTLVWGQESKPQGTTTIPASPSFSSFSAAAVAGTYRTLLGDVRRTTPKATSIGNGEFIVRWIDNQSAAQSGLFSSIYRPAEPIGSRWDAPVDLTTFAVIDPTDPVSSAVDLLVDTNGWATLIYRQREDPTSATSPFQVFARRANLAFNSAGAGAFATSSTPVQISAPGTDVSFPAASNVHSSGAFSLVWQFQSPGTGGGAAASALSRFQ